MDFGALPPEINSARMYAGPGSGPLVAAATAWNELAADLTAAAASYKSVVSSLTTGRWLGPSSLSAASALGPYVAWTAGAAARAAEAASHASLGADIYEAALSMTVPPQAVAANRVQLSTLVATNFLGQNTAAIAATEAAYVEMWAQDAAAMYQYAAGAVEASSVTPFTSPPQVTDVAGTATQAAAVSQATGGAAQQFSLAGLMSSIPSALQNLATPAASTASTGGLSGLLSGLSGNSTLSGLMSGLTSTEFANLAPTYVMSSLTPLYGLSSVLGMAQSLQGLTAATAQGAEAAVAGAAGDVAAAAADTAGAFGAMGQAGALGSLSVPPAWTSIIPAAHLTSAGATLDNGGMGALSRMSPQPSLLGGLPRVAGAAGSSAAPRYGLVPTVMAQPPSGGYGSELF
jgi:PPE-repeat protein